jgi:hypothetical protein
MAEAEAASLLGRRQRQAMGWEGVLVFGIPVLVLVLVLVLGDRRQATGDKRPADGDV